jgi:hypothetical protein
MLPPRLGGFGGKGSRTSSNLQYAKARDVAKASGFALSRNLAVREGFEPSIPFWGMAL